MKKGFTLLELLVIVFIIGILSAVALPQYRRSVRRAEMMEGLINGKTFWESAMRYQAVNGVSPTDFSQLDSGMIGGGSFSGEEYNDGNFTYSLADNDYLLIISNKGGYSLHMNYMTSTDPKAEIHCYPNASDELGTWLCKNVGKTVSGQSYTRIE